MQQAISDCRTHCESLSLALPAEHEDACALAAQAAATMVEGIFLAILTTKKFAAAQQKGHLKAAMSKLEVQSATYKADIRPWCNRRSGRKP